MTAIITPTRAQFTSGFNKKVNCARVGVIIAVTFFLFLKRKYLLSQNNVRH
jgi:hypothetical protein